MSLPNFLRHPPIPTFASALSNRFAALAPAIDYAALGHGLVYTWRAFAAFAPEKVSSDLIEAVLGPV